MIAESKKWRLNSRSIAYSAVLIVLLALVFYFFNNRSSVETTILRAPAMLYQEQPDGRISNLYNLKMLNKTNIDMKVELKLLSHEAEIKMVGELTEVLAQTVGESVFFILFNKDEIQNQETILELAVYSNGEIIEKIKTTFIGPNE